MHYKLQPVLLRTEQVAQKTKSRKHAHKENEVAALGEEKGGRGRQLCFLFLCRDIFLKFQACQKGLQIHARKATRHQHAELQSVTAPASTAPAPPHFPSVPSVEPRVPLPEPGSELYVSRLKAVGRRERSVSAVFESTCR